MMRFRDQRQHRLVLLWLVAASTLVGCGKPIPVSDVVGTYRAEVPGGEATLVVRGDDTWVYEIEPLHFYRTGKWSSSLLKAWPYPVSFSNFEFGPPLRNKDRQKPELWTPKFMRAHSGGVQHLCTVAADKSPFCFKRVQSSAD
jgi:hypothetical protein